MTSKEFKKMLKDGERRSHQYTITWPNTNEFPENTLCSVNGLRADKYCKKHFGADMALYINAVEEYLTWEVYIPLNGPIESELEEQNNGITQPEPQSMTFPKEYIFLLQQAVPKLNQLIGLTLAIQNS